MAQVTTRAHEHYLELADGSRWPIDGAVHMEAHSETVRVAQVWMPDTNWSDVDANGHAHHYVKDREDVPRLPSLERRSRMEECPGGCGDADCVGDWVEEWFCRQCGVQVKPGFRTEYDKVIPVSTTVVYDLRVIMPNPDRPLIKDARYVQIRPEAVFMFGEREWSFDLPWLDVLAVEQSHGMGATSVVVMQASQRKSVTSKPTGP